VGAFLAVFMIVDVVVVTVLTSSVDVRVFWDIMVTEGVLVCVTVPISSDVGPDSADVESMVIHCVITVVVGDGLTVTTVV
jgi:hypothetical protein